MIKKAIVILPFVLALIAHTLSAQDFKRKTEKLIEKSKEALLKRNWEASKNFMNQAVAAEDENYLVYLEKAALHYGARNFQEVVPSLETAFQLEQQWPAKYQEFYFILGKESFDNGKYVQAKKPLLLYKERGYNAESVKLTDVILQSVDYAINELKNYQDSTFDIKTINSEKIFHSVYFPFFTLYPAEFLYFTGQRGNSQEEGIYRAQLKEGEFQKVEEVPVVNTNENEGAAAISADGRVMVFTSCNRRGGYGSCDLYISYAQNGQWQQPENIGANINTSAWESQPFLSSDGRLLIFSSNRKGGFGKRDLYYSRKIDGVWSKSVNLGETVNSFADEISPYLNLSNDTLYFSSNGRIGMGGFDIYKVNWNNTNSAPENIGYPVNTYANEISFHQKMDGMLYWSREVGEDSRFPASKIFYYNKGTDQNKNVGLVYGYITDAENNKPINAKVQIFDLEKDSLIHETESNSIDGLYKIIIPGQSAYSFYVESEGYLFQSKQIALSSTEPTEVNFELSRVKKGESISLDNIYFEFDSYELNEKSRNEIEKIAAFLKLNASIKIEIGGYTDQKGSDAYNQRLSEQRAKAVYEALIKKGVEAGRVSAKGYGKAPQPDGHYAKTVRLKIL